MKSDLYKSDRARFVGKDAFNDTRNVKLASTEQN